MDDATFLTELDFENGAKLTHEELSASRILSQQPNKKGDIRGKAAWSLKSTDKNIRRNGVVTGVKKWPNGRIPYVISNQYNERERAVLARSFQEYHRKTCIRFVPRTALDHDYLYIGKIDGCFSDVGRAGGRQELSLDDGCMQYDTAIHENGFETMVAKRPEMTTVIGSAIDFSPVDVLKMNMMYQCSEAKELPGSMNSLLPKPPVAPPTLPISITAPVSTGGNSVSSENEECRDRTNLCWRWLDRCRSFFFEKIMREFCPLSCGFCSPKQVAASPSSFSALSFSSPIAPSALKLSPAFPVLSPTSPASSGTVKAREGRPHYLQFGR
ncbi:hypothetical protein WR25_03266 [Diploscapter pachys]|uniref:ShKT domain-containing protein n=1 Tax=Diploscapter pachys TaxID=2018661 RepID=A0A2A2JPZ9_9BILA|nr:hypothetical protein WR25_03266 [Diploscapter pachys]